MRYKLDFHFNSRKPNKDQQFILTEAFREAFKCKNFPEITEKGLTGEISSEDSKFADFLYV
jgi:hypothetical protein